MPGIASEHCATCSLPLELCVCEDIETTSSPVSVSIDNRRYGKTVTIVAAPELSAEKLAKLATHLKRSLATGGTYHEQDGRIELQGDHRKKAVAELAKLGYAAST